MLNQIRNRLSWLVILKASAIVSASAAQRNSILLSLVPSGDEIVSGIANPGTPGASGRLLLVTDRNNRDFNDCLALLGIDGERSIEQVVEAASSPFSRDLSEYLLLLAGNFNRFGICKVALENGATSLEHDGVSLMAIPPFQREQRQFNRVRWLAIIDERILVFGTPAMVRNVSRAVAGVVAIEEELALGVDGVDDAVATVKEMGELLPAAQTDDRPSSHRQYRSEYCRGRRGAGPRC